MNILKDIHNNTIIICEKTQKKAILKEMSKKHIFLNVKFYTKKEFLNEYLFNYNEKTIYYLVNKYNFKVEIAKMYLDNLYYIDDNLNYKSNKLNFLVSLKKELDEKKLLIYNKEFKKNIKNYNVLIAPYSYLENIEIKIFKSLNAKFILNNPIYEINQVYEFSSMEEEINFVLKKICDLIKEGISINKIKLMGVDEEYYNDLKRLSDFYNIPIKIPDKNSLYGNIITKKFLDNYDSDITKSIDAIKNMDSDITKSIDAIKNMDSDIVNRIINICNKYNFVSDYNDIKDLIICDLKNINIDNFKLKNYLEIININDYIMDDEYVFLMNFNAGSIPKFIKDENYITDNIKDEIGVQKSIDINKYIKEFTINKLKSIKNLWITYKQKNSKQEFFVSPLVKDLNLIVIKEKCDILKSYSKLNDKINFAIVLENFEKYGNIIDEYYIYKNSLGNISYNSYDNKYHHIDKNELKDYLKNKLTLSYTSLNNYNKCSFKYYIANILKLDKYEETFEAFIGSIFHNVLEKCFKRNLNVEEEITRYINESGKVLGVKERFFINKIIEDIKFVIKVLNNQKEYISLDKEIYEQNIVIKKMRDIPVEFVGFIDKILYKETDGSTLISIIDYKTGFIDIILNYVPYGLNLQLPIYLYLVKKSNMFKNPKFLGFYLQYILDKDIVRDNKKTYAEQRWNNLKLVGYSNSNIHNLVELDKTYENSNLIKSLKVKTNGEFASSAKILSDENIDNLINLTEKNIDDSINKILDADFTINPKKIGYDDDIGCKFCKFKDLCFKKETDYVILEKKDSLNFLGGDENA